MTSKERIVARMKRIVTWMKSIQVPERDLSDNSIGCDIVLVVLVVALVAVDVMMSVAG